MKKVSESELNRRKNQSEEQKLKNKRTAKLQEIISSVPVEVILENKFLEVEENA